MHRAFSYGIATSAIFGLWFGSSAHSAQVGCITALVIAGLLWLIWITIPCGSHLLAGEGAFGDLTLRTYRIAEENLLWERLNASSNLSIIDPGGSGKSTMLASIDSSRTRKMAEIKTRCYFATTSAEDEVS